MKLLYLLKNLVYGLYKALRRFPLTIGLSTIISILLIVVNHNRNNFSSSTIEDLYRYSMIFGLGIPISLCLYLLFEKKSITSIKLKLMCFGSEALLLLLYLVFFLKDFEMVSITRYSFLTAACYLVFIYIAYYFKHVGFELYVIRLLSRFFTTVLCSLILYLGIYAILFTIRKLFLININEKLYFDIFIIIAGVFVPAFFLAGVPLVHQQMKDEDYPKLLKILLLYIIIPLLSIYTVILYIYFGKVILTLQWPIQLVMHLVLWYSFISVAVVFLVLILIEANKWVGRFVSIYTKAIFPLLLMLFIAIGKRVAIYGVTESRYFVIILSFWVLGIMLYLNLSKKKRSIILPISLSMLFALSVLGPWSCYSISKYTQNKRFDSILVKNKMLTNNNIIKSNKTVSETDKRELSNIIAYFSHNHEISDIKHLPKGFTTTDMNKIFGFTYSDYANTNNYSSTKYFYYNSSPDESPINISGYDYLIGLRDKTFSKMEVENGVSFTFENATSTIKIFKNNSLLYEGTILKFIEKLFAKYGYENHEIDKKDEMVFTDENSKLKIKFIFFHINGSKESTSDKLKLDYINFYLLIKVK